MVIPYIIGVIGIAALVCVWYLACREFGRIAADKGYSDRRYFHFCFWLGLVGMLMVIALPDRGDGKARSRAVKDASDVPVAFSDEGSRTPPASSFTARKPRQYTDAAPAPWRCSCGKGSIRSRRCPSCWTWLCTCGAMNPAPKATCDSCGVATP